MPLYEFRCPRGHVTERLMNLDDAVDSIRCPAKMRRPGTCGQRANRAISAPVVFSEDFFTARNYEKRKDKAIPIR